MDPGTVAQGISQQGWPYLFAGLAIVSGLSIGYLFRALLAAKDQQLTMQNQHKDEIVKMVDTSADAMVEVRNMIGGMAQAIDKMGRTSYRRESEDRLEPRRLE